MRSDSDSWDLASSVGATATMVAVGRALASADPQPLINDPYAAPLVRAMGMDFFTQLLDDDVDLSSFPGRTPEQLRAGVNRIAVRTRFFDDYFIDAAASGIRQIVILAAGLDSRAYRLDWPTGTTVYEVDQPEVIEFKSRTLAALGAQPAAERHTVGIDLRDDWPAALTAAGFDRSAPTAWLAEGLLIYLPAAAQDRLFDLITELSAPSSRVATEYVPGIMDFDSDRAREMSAPLRDRGVDIDMGSLVYAGARNHVPEYLDTLGWQVSGSASDDLFTRFGRAVPPADDNDALGDIVYISASR